jgi:peroxiredoxin
MKVLKFFTLIVTCFVTLFFSEIVDSSASEDNLNSVQAKLDAKLKDFEKTASEEKKAAYEKGLEEIQNSGILSRALKKGDVVPDFSMTSSNGEEYSLLGLLNKGPIVVTWYRGGWCPYCNIYLKGLRDAKEDIQELGGQIIAISPEKPEKTEETITNNKIPFIVISDKDNNIAKKFNISYKLPDIVLEQFEGRIDLNEYNGNENNELPLSATYVIDQDANIIYSFLDVDYRKRAEPAEIIQVLKTEKIKREEKEKAKLEELKSQG